MSFPAPIHRKRLVALLLLACGLLLPSQAGFSQRTREPIHILVISFGSRDWPPFVSLVEEFRAELERQENAPIYIYVETLDAYAPGNGHDFEETMEQLLPRKYGNRSFDLVVAAGAQSMDFLIPRHAKMFPKAKVLYTTVFHPPVLGATGVITEANLLPTAEMALRQNPGTRRLLLISGSSFSDQTGIVTLKQGLQGQLNRAGRGVQVETMPPMTYSDTRRYLSTLPRDMVGIFVFYFGDSAGQVVNPTRVLEEFSGLCPRPIYSVWEADVGRGSVGGRVISGTLSGRALAGQAARVLRAEDPGKIPLVHGGFQFDLFDWRQMKRWGIRLDQLPPGSTVLNREYTAWELYQWQILGGAVVILVETALLLLLLHLRRVRRKSVLELAHRHKLESVMAELSGAFINLPGDMMNAEVDSALEHLLAALELDRISVFELPANGQEPQLIFAKTAVGLPAPPAEAPQAELAWLMPKLLRGEKVVAPRLEDLPPDAEPLRQFAASLGIRSIAIFPLHCDGLTFGKMACATVQRNLAWPGEMLEYLQGVADVFGNALKRKRAEEALVNSEQLKASILSSLSSQIAVVDRNGSIIASNDQWRAFAQKHAGHPDWIGEEGSPFGPCTSCEPACQPAEAVMQGMREVWEGRRASFEMEYECLSENGRERWFFMTVTPLKNQDGGAVIAHHDITESKRNEQAIRELSGRLITAQEEERSRIARELHDDINQQLALLAIELQLLDKSAPNGPFHSQLERLWKKTNEISGEIQGLSHRLHSAKLEHLGLISALRDLCQDFRKQQQIAIEFEAGDVPSPLHSETSLSLFRIAQECLRNVGKHSQARKVRVNLQGGAGHLVLRISDDGVGFAPGRLSARSGLGMVSMQERLRLVGGAFLVRSVESGGTVVEARVPIPPRQEDSGPSPAGIPAKRPSVGEKGGDVQPAGEDGANGVYQVRSHS